MAARRKKSKIRQEAAKQRYLNEQRKVSKPVSEIAGIDLGALLVVAAIPLDNELERL